MRSSARLSVSTGSVGRRLVAAGGGAPLRPLGAFPHTRRRGPMYFPTSHPWADGETLGEYLEKRGVDRREFLTFCGEMTAVLGLGSLLTPRVAEALAAVKRPSVIWLQLQECTGCVESVIRTAEPTIGDLVLDVVSLDYQHTLMAAAGHQAEQALQKAMADHRGEYLLVVTGSVPLNEGGIYCTIGGRTAKSILEEAGKGAKAVIAVSSRV